MNHIGLFEGIGGFSLAARYMGWNTLAVCEIDPFCQKVLKHHFPEATLHEDITETDFTIYKGKCDILTGGFPCQPFSNAGKQDGKDDNRFLWPQFERAIREIEPHWVVAENVYGLLTIDNGFTAELMCDSLEACGYERPLIFDCPNCAFGAPTVERHLWFISEANGKRFKRSKTNTNTNDKYQKQFQRTDTGENYRRYISDTRFFSVGERVSGWLDKWDKATIKAAGNAIDPNVAYQIFKAINAMQ